ncbi:MAG: trimeric intracellular cation channel family protein [Bacteroidia bacterium]
MTILSAFELTGTFFFAISGALAVKDKEHDWFGAGFTGFITAIGGGSLRDVLLGSYPLAWVSNVNLLYAIIAGVAVTYFGIKYLLRLRRTLFFFDTLGLSLFTILGTEKALSLGVQEEIAAIMGMFSAVMGGVIRDTLTNEIPVLFRKEIYASACLLGAIIYLLLRETGLPREANLIISVCSIASIRFLAVRYKITLGGLSL